MHDPSARRLPLTPPSRQFSILPAAAVLILAVITLGSFAIVDFIASPSTTATTIPNIVVGGLKNDLSTTVFTGWRVDELPPGNIASALIAPVGTTFVGAVNTGGSAIDYDMENRLSIAVPVDKLLGFYRSNLEALGWKVISSGAAPTGGIELLFQKAGSTDYWEAGVVAQATPGGRTSYTFRLFDVTDSE